MNHAYNSSESSTAYEQFLESVDGKIFRDVVGKDFLGALDRGLSLDSGFPTQSAGQAQAGMTKKIRILDAGCGDGWLAGIMSGPPPNIGGVRGGIDQEKATPPNLPYSRGGINAEVHACDAGEPLIKLAKEKFPEVQFSVCDLNQPLPYQKESFDVVTASMVIHDVEDELAALKNMAEVLKPGGKLLASIVNPYYGYPIGEWKRGIMGRLLNKKPSLRLARFYNQMMHQNRPNFEWRKNLGSHFTPLSTHITNASQAGLVLTGLKDIQSETDSPTYNLTYQLHRFPIILLLEFTKL